MARHKFRDRNKGQEIDSLHEFKISSFETEKERAQRVQRNNR